MSGNADGEPPPIARGAGPGEADGGRGTATPRTTAHSATTAGFTERSNSVSRRPRRLRRRRRRQAARNSAPGTAAELSAPPRARGAATAAGAGSNTGRAYRSYRAASTASRTAIVRPAGRVAPPSGVRCRRGSGGGMTAASAAGATTSRSDIRGTTGRLSSRRSASRATTASATSANTRGGSASGATGNHGCGSSTLTSQRRTVITGSSGPGR